MPRITIEADAKQLAIILSHLEAVRPDGTITKQLADAERRWGTDDDDSFSYEVVKITPVYLQLRRCWEKLVGGERTRAGVTETDSASEFRRAIRAARTAVAMEVHHG